MKQVCTKCGKEWWTDNAGAGGHVCGPKGGVVVQDPRDLYGNWSTAELALKAVTQERDALLLQVRDLSVALERISQSCDGLAKDTADAALGYAEKPKGVLPDGPHFYCNICGYFGPIEYPHLKKNAQECCNYHAGPVELVKQPQCAVVVHNDVAEHCVHKCGHDLPCPYHTEKRMPPVQFTEGDIKNLEQMSQGLPDPVTRGDEDL